MASILKRAPRQPPVQQAVVHLLPIMATEAALSIHAQEDSPNVPTVQHYWETMRQAMEADQAAWEQVEAELERQITDLLDSAAAGLSYAH